MDPDFLENEEKYKTIKRGGNAKANITLRLSNQLSLLSQFNQSAVTSQQISWTRAAAIQERRETAATKMRTKKMRTRRREKVRQTGFLF